MLRVRMARGDGAYGVYAHGELYDDYDDPDGESAASPKAVEKYLQR